MPGCACIWCFDPNTYHDGRVKSKWKRVLNQHLGNGSAINQQLALKQGAGVAGDVHSLPQAQWVQEWWEVFTGLPTQNYWRSQSGCYDKVNNTHHYRRSQSGCNNEVNNTHHYWRSQSGHNSEVNNTAKPGTHFLENNKIIGVFTMLKLCVSKEFVND